MRSRRLAVEPLENRTLLAADVAAEILPQEPLPGDANQDGAFDQSDLTQALQAGKYLTGEQAEWSEGDWNRDGNFNELDLVFAFQAGNDAVGIAAQGDGQAIERTFHAEFKELQWLGLSEPPSGRCPEGYMLSTYVGTSVARHLGKTEATAIHCTTPGGGVVEGMLTLIAANGDELYATYTGGVTFVDPPVLGYSADHQFFGGTGRFVGATGTATELGTLDMTTSTGTSTIEGVFTYNASQRRA